MRTHSSYNNLLSLFATAGEQDSAKVYLDKALRVVTSGKTNTRQRSITYKWAGLFYEQLKDYPLAKMHYKMSLNEYKFYLSSDNRQVKKVQRALEKVDSLIIRDGSIKKGGL